MVKQISMFSLVLLLGVFLLGSMRISATAGQWSANGSSIYYNDGNIGIGMNNPSVLLDITGNNAASDVITLRLGSYPGRFWSFYGGKYGDITTGDYALTIAQPSYPDCTTCKGDLKFKPGRNSIFGQGNVGIGQSNPTEKLEVNGTIKAKKVIVTASGWADYVFENDYKLLPLAKLEEYINQNKHLPGISSASEIESNGISIADMQTKQMEKIEELTLYIIQKDKKINDLEARLSKLESLIVSK